MTRLEAKERLLARRDQDWFHRLEEKQAYLRKYPNSKFRARVSLSTNPSQSVSKIKDSK